MNRFPLILALLVAAAVLACDSEHDDPYEGKMGDRTYAAQIVDGECLLRPDASGTPTCIDRFAGRFVWADYAAPWCAPCEVQAPVLEKLQKELGDSVIFVTVMTSESADFQSIPTVETARRWSARFGLDPSRVVVADNLWGMSIPTHILYSPKGQSLYRSSGYMTAPSIRAVIEERTADWLEYDASGKRASWMR